MSESSSKKNSTLVALVVVLVVAVILAVVLFGQRNSLSAQVDYFSSVVKENPDWEPAGIYVDAGATGTSIGPRPEFQRLIEDCRRGKIDLVLTKSVSRFARNTAELLSVVRELKALGVEVRFER